MQSFRPKYNLIYSFQLQGRHSIHVQYNHVSLTAEATAYR